MVLFEVITGGALLEPQNISNIIVQNSYVLILAIGMILVIISGHIDLSAGSVVAMTGAVAAVLTVNLGLPWPLAVVLTLVVGAVIGAWQGYWVAYFGIPAFIVTLAGMLAFRALTLTVLGNQGIGPFPDAIRTLSNGFTGGYLGNIGLGPLGGADLVSLLAGVVVVAGIVLTQWRKRAARLGYGQEVDPFPLFVLKIAVAAALVLAVVVQLARFRNLPWVLVLLAVLVLGYSLVAGKSVFGRHVYAIGGNLQAATLSGVKVKSVTFWVFVNMGVLAALMRHHLRRTAQPGGAHRGRQLRTRRHRRRVHRRRGGPGRGRQGGRSHHRRPDHGGHQQRNVLDRGAQRTRHAGQRRRPARRGRVRHLDQAPRRGSLTRGWLAGDPPAASAVLPARGIFPAPQRKRYISSSSIPRQHRIPARGTTWSRSAADRLARDREGAGSSPASMSIPRLLE